MALDLLFTTHKDHTFADVDGLQDSGSEHEHAFGHGVLRQERFNTPDHAASMPVPAQAGMRSSVPLTKKVIVGPLFLQEICRDHKHGQAVSSLFVNAVQEVLLFDPSKAQSYWTSPSPSHLKFILRCALLAGTAARLVTHGPREFNHGRSALMPGEGHPIRKASRRREGLQSMRRNHNAFGDHHAYDHALSFLEHLDLPFVASNQVLGDEAWDAPTLGGLLRRVTDRYAASASMIAAQRTPVAAIMTPAAMATEIVATFEAAGLSLRTLPFTMLADICVVFPKLVAASKPLDTTIANASSVLALDNSGFEQLLAVNRVILTATTHATRADVAAQFASK